MIVCPSFEAARINRNNRQACSVFQIGQQLAPRYYVVRKPGMVRRYQSIFINVEFAPVFIASCRSCSFGRTFSGHGHGAAVQVQKSSTGQAKLPQESNHAMDSWKHLLILVYLFCYIRYASEPW